MSRLGLGHALGPIHVKTLLPSFPPPSITSHVGRFSLHLPGSTLEAGEAHHVKHRSSPAGRPARLAQTYSTPISPDSPPPPTPIDARFPAERAFGRSKAATRESRFNSPKPANARVRALRGGQFRSSLGKEGHRIHLRVARRGSFSVPYPATQYRPWIRARRGSKLWARAVFVAVLNGFTLDAREARHLPRTRRSGDEAAAQRRPRKGSAGCRPRLRSSPGGPIGLAFTHSIKFAPRSQLRPPLPRGATRDGQSKTNRLPHPLSWRTDDRGLASIHARRARARTNIHRKGK